MNTGVVIAVVAVVAVVVVAAIIIKKRNHLKNELAYSWQLQHVQYNPV